MGRRATRMRSRGDRRKADQRQPSDVVVRLNEVAHLPYRNWCRSRVHGRGENRPHRARQNGKGLYFEFMFFGDRDGLGGTRTCVVAWEVDTRVVLATRCRTSQATFSCSIGPPFCCRRSVACVGTWGRFRPGGRHQVHRGGSGQAQGVRERRQVDHRAPRCRANCVQRGGGARDPVGPGTCQGDAPRGAWGSS